MRAEKWGEAPVVIKAREIVEYAETLERRQRKVRSEMQVHIGGQPILIGVLERWIAILEGREND